MAEIIIFTDGGSRGNPGPAALGVYITNTKNEVLAKIGEYLGITTNNVAEYSAIIKGLSWAIENKKNQEITKIHFYMDSQLACSQLNGLYKIKNNNIRTMVFEIHKKEAELAVPIIYTHIRRENNKQADFMVNVALDNQLKKT